VLKDLVGMVVTGQNGLEETTGGVGLVDRECVVRDDLPEGVGDAVQQSVEGLVREHLVDHVGKESIGVDELFELLLVTYSRLDYH
jgi:hypothetical protein